MVTQQQIQDLQNNQIAQQAAVDKANDNLITAKLSGDQGQISVAQGVANQAYSDSAQSSAALTQAQNDFAVQNSSGIAQTASDTQTTDLANINNFNTDYSTATPPSSFGGINPNVSGNVGSGLTSDFSSGTGFTNTLSTASSTTSTSSSSPQASTPSTVDRRVRLRPRDGARSLYYGQGTSPGSSTSARANLLANPLTSQQTNFEDAQGIATALSNGSSPTTQVGPLPWLSNGAGQTLPWAVNNPSAPNAPIQTTSTGSVVNGVSTNILAPLAATNGMVWPYTPTIDYSQAIDYTSYDPVHSIQELHSFVRTKAPTINVSGKFTAQNASEASYCLAAIHFFKTVSKMAFGQSQNPGTPPPILLFSAYGEYQFNDLPIIMTNCNISYPDDVDYIQVPNTNTYVPAIFTIQCSLVVQNSPNKLRQFNLEQFRNGTLLQQGGWI